MNNQLLPKPSKLLVRRIKSSVERRLALTKPMFQNNRHKLIQAKDKSSELIDIMPGINMPMVIHPEMYFCVAYTNYIFEPESLYFISDHLSQGQTVLDVGANVGYFSLFFAKIVGSTGRVIAFEPGEFAYNLLHRNRDLNKLNCLEIHQAGLGEQDNIVTFNSGEPGMEVYNSLGDIAHPAADLSKFHKSSIQLFEGSSWLEKNNVEHIDLMKLDVEGGEYTVLKGMLPMFCAQKISLLLIEITYEMSQVFGYHPSDLISMLRDCGYDWFELRRFGELVPLITNSPSKSGMFVAVSRKNN